MKPQTILAFLLLASTPAVHSQTVEEVLARYLEARGGDNLKKVRTVVATGQAILGGGMEAPFRYEWKKPDKFRFEMTMQGVTQVQAYDGETPWETDPPDQPEPVRMGPLDFALLNDAVDFLGPLVDPAAKGHTVELLGKEEFEGSEAYKLKVTKADGMVETSFLDAEYFLEIAQIETYEMNEQEVVLQTTWSDYKEYDGAVLPSSWSRSPPGGPAQITLMFQNIELNAELPDSRFAMAGESD